MNDLFQAEGKYELQDLLKPSIWLNSRKQWFVFVIAGVIFLIGVIGVLLTHFSPIYVFILALPLLMLGIKYYQITSSAKKALQASNCLIEYSFTRMGYEIKTNSSLVKNEWDNLQAVKENETAFLLFPQANLFHVVPKRFFADERDLAELRETIRIRLGSKAVLKQLN